MMHGDQDQLNGIQELRVKELIRMSIGHEGPAGKGEVAGWLVKAVAWRITWPLGPAIALVALVVPAMAGSLWAFSVTQAAEMAAQEYQAQTQLVISQANTALAKLEERSGQPGSEASSPSLPSPVGSIVAWPTNVKPPSSWRICEGGKIDFSPLLWERLQGLYGNAQRGAKIQLPNFKGRFLRGAEGSAKKIGDKQEDAIGFPTDLYMGGDNTDTVPGSNVFVISRGPWKKLAKGENRSVLSDRETRPVNYAVSWIIRVK